MRSWKFLPLGLREQRLAVQGQVAGLVLQVQRPPTMHLHLLAESHRHGWKVIVQGIAKHQLDLSPGHCHSPPRSLRSCEMHFVVLISLLQLFQASVDVRLSSSWFCVAHTGNLAIPDVVRCECLAATRHHHSKKEQVRLLVITGGKSGPMLAQHPVEPPTRRQCTVSARAQKRLNSLHLLSWTTSSFNLGIRTICHHMLRRTSSKPCSTSSGKYNNNK